MTLATLPTRKLEDWRYADIDALARIWPPEEGPERISVRAGDAQRMVITGLEPKDGVALREIEITLLPGARFSLFALVHGAAYARLSVKVELMEGAHFELGGVILGSGDQIGRASCRERVCQYVSIAVVGVSLKKKQNNISITYNTQV